MANDENWNESGHGCGSGMHGEPEHDMDGGYFHGQPTPEQIAEYEAWQKQSADWSAKGLCYECGGKNPDSSGLCKSCMDRYCDAMYRKV